MADPCAAGGRASRTSFAATAFADTCPPWLQFSVEELEGQTVGFPVKKVGESCSIQVRRSRVVRLHCQHFCSASTGRSATRNTTCLQVDRRLRAWRRVRWWVCSRQVMGFKYEEPSKSILLSPTSCRSPTSRSSGSQTTPRSHRMPDSGCALGDQVQAP